MNDNIVPFPRQPDEVTDLDVVREHLVEIISDCTDLKKAKAEAGEVLDLIEAMIVKGATN